MSAARLARLRPELVRRGVDALLVTKPENRRWLSGVRAEDASPTSLAGWLLVTPDAAEFVTTFNYDGEAREQADGVEVVCAEPTQKLHEAVAARIAELGARRVGFETDWISVQARDDLAEALTDRVQLAPLKGVVEPLRAVKDAAEIALIKRAVAISDAAVMALFAELRPGMTEAEAAWFLESHMRQHGAEGVSFPVGVAAGLGAAVPHHKPTDRPIRAGEPLWMDVGAKVDGYCSDVTRTVVLGHGDERYGSLWHEVLEAQRRALDFVKPGLTGRECDAHAREYLESKGLGAAFGHGLGHGVGLLIHEAPWLTRTMGDAVLEPGMIVTVEPGVYFDDWGGVRHEELCVVCEGGLEVLTSAPKPEML